MNELQVAVQATARDINTVLSLHRVQSGVRDEVRALLSKLMRQSFQSQAVSWGISFGPKVGSECNISTELCTESVGGCTASYPSDSLCSSKLVTATRIDSSAVCDAPSDVFDFCQSVVIGVVQKTIHQVLPQRELYAAQCKVEALKEELHESRRLLQLEQLGRSRDREALQQTREAQLYALRQYFKEVLLLRKKVNSREALLESTVQAIRTTGGKDAPAGQSQVPLYRSGSTAGLLRCASTIVASQQKTVERESASPLSPSFAPILPPLDESKAESAMANSACSSKNSTQMFRTKLGGAVGSPTRSTGSAIFAGNTTVEGANASAMLDGLRSAVSGETPGSALHSVMKVTATSRRENAASDVSAGEEGDVASIDDDAARGKIQRRHRNGDLFLGNGEPLSDVRDGGAVDGGGSCGVVLRAPSNATDLPSKTSHLPIRPVAALANSVDAVFDYETYITKAFGSNALRLFTSNADDIVEIAAAEALRPGNLQGLLAVCAAIEVDGSGEDSDEAKEIEDAEEPVPSSRRPTYNQMRRQVLQCKKRIGEMRMLVVRQEQMIRERNHTIESLRAAFDSVQGKLANTSWRMQLLFEPVKRDLKLFLGSIRSACMQMASEYEKRMGDVMTAVALLKRELTLMNSFQTSVSYEVTHAALNLATSVDEARKRLEDKDFIKVIVSQTGYVEPPPPLKKLLRGPRGERIQGASRSELGLDANDATALQTLANTIQGRGRRVHGSREASPLGSSPGPGALSSVPGGARPLVPAVSTFFSTNRLTEKARRQPGTKAAHRACSSMPQVSDSQASVAGLQYQVRQVMMLLADVLQQRDDAVKAYAKLLSKRHAEVMASRLREYLQSSELGKSVSGRVREEKSGTGGGLPELGDEPKGSTTASQLSSASKSATESVAGSGGQHLVSGTTSQETGMVPSDGKVAFTTPDVERLLTALMGRLDDAVLRSVIARAHDSQLLQHLPEEAQPAVNIIGFLASALVKSAGKIREMKQQVVELRREKRAAFRGSYLPDAPLRGAGEDADALGSQSALRPPLQPSGPGNVHMGFLDPRVVDIGLPASQRDPRMNNFFGGGLLANRFNLGAAAGSQQSGGTGAEAAAGDELYGDMLTFHAADPETWLNLSDFVLRGRALLTSHLSREPSSPASAIPPSPHSLLSGSRLSPRAEPFFSEAHDAKPETTGARDELEWMRQETAASPASAGEATEGVPLHWGQSAHGPFAVTGYGIAALRGPCFRALVGGRPALVLTEAVAGDGADTFWSHPCAPSAPSDTRGGGAMTAPVRLPQVPQSPGEGGGGESSRGGRQAQPFITHPRREWLPEFTTPSYLEYYHGAPCSSYNALAAVGDQPLQQGDHLWNSYPSARLRPPCCSIKQAPQVLRGDDCAPCPGTAPSATSLSATPPSCSLPGARGHNATKARRSTQLPPSSIPLRPAAEPPSLAPSSVRVGTRPDVPVARAPGKACAPAVGSLPSGRLPSVEGKK